jgi:myo-inositol catabolism protein IolC
VSVDWSQKELLILAFDHRGSFLEKMFGIKGRQPTPEEKKMIEDYKKLFFEVFRLATKTNVPIEFAGLLVDGKKNLTLNTATNSLSILKSLTLTLSRCWFATIHKATLK